MSIFREIKKEHVKYALGIIAKGCAGAVLDSVLKPYAPSGRLGRGVHYVGRYTLKSLIDEPIDRMVDSKVENTAEILNIVSNIKTENA